MSRPTRVATEEDLDPSQALLYHTPSILKSQLMNGTVPALPESLEGAPEPSQKIQVVADSEILAKRDPRAASSQTGCTLRCDYHKIIFLKKRSEEDGGTEYTGNGSASPTPRQACSSERLLELPDSAAADDDSSQSRALRSRLCIRSKSTRRRAEKYLYSVWRIAWDIDFVFIARVSHLLLTSSFHGCRKVVFVHRGCFWHGHSSARGIKTPKRQ